jgi:Nucleotide modification associated domain 2
VNLFAYRVVYDIGFAPNPFFGTCTLATCKPRIRRAAHIGDWVVGLGSIAQKQDGKLIYALRVSEKLTFDEYWTDPRFQRKKPNRNGSLKQRYGDNVYHREFAEGPWIQEDCRHSLDDGSPNTDHVVRDTGAPVVLIANEFCYYGSAAPQIPKRFRDFEGRDVCAFARDYRRNFHEPLKVAFIDWLKERCVDGLAGEPLDWRGLY